MAFLLCLCYRCIYNDMQKQEREELRQLHKQKQDLTLCIIDRVKFVVNSRQQEITQWMYQGDSNDLIKRRLYPDIEIILPLTANQARMKWYHKTIDEYLSMYFPCNVTS